MLQQSWRCVVLVPPGHPHGHTWDLNQSLPHHPVPQTPAPRLLRPQELACAPSPGAALELALPLLRCCCAALAAVLRRANGSTSSGDGSAGGGGGGAWLRDLGAQAGACLDGTVGDALAEVSPGLPPSLPCVTNACVHSSGWGTVTS